MYDFERKHNPFVNIVDSWWSIILHFEQCAGVVEVISGDSLQLIPLIHDWPMHAHSLLIGSHHEIASGFKKLMIVVWFNPEGTRRAPPPFLLR